MASLRRIEGVSVRQITVKNRFFGPSVTVTGLLSGGDLVAALKGKRLGDMVIVPSNMLKEEEDVFIDDMSLDQLERSIKTKVVKVDGFKDLITALRRGGKETQ